MKKPKKIFLNWDFVTDSAKKLADHIINYIPSESLDKVHIIAPEYGGWPLAAMIVNSIRDKKLPHFKPETHSYNIYNVIRHLIYNNEETDYFLIIDDVYDTGETINNILENIQYLTEHHRHLFERIFDRILICTIGRKTKCVYNCRHFYTIEWEKNEWIVFPWESLLTSSDPEPLS